MHTDFYFYKKGGRLSVRLQPYWRRPAAGMLITMEKLTVSDVRPMLREVSRLMEEQRETLTRLDAEMGDGDLGLTMTKGFRLLGDGLVAEEGDSVGSLFMKAGRMLAAGAPSTMGTLMASGLLGGGKALLGSDQMGAKEFAAFLEGFCGGLSKRGKCRPGDRTVLDAMDAAAQEASLAYRADRDLKLEELSRRALLAAKTGAERTRDMTPKFGKALVHRDRAKGRIDQGAFAGVIFVEGLYTYIAQPRQASSAQTPPRG